MMASKRALKDSHRYSGGLEWWEIFSMWFVGFVRLNYIGRFVSTIFYEKINIKSILLVWVFCSSHGTIHKIRYKWNRGGLRVSISTFLKCCKLKRPLISYSLRSKLDVFHLFTCGCIYTCNMSRYIRMWTNGRQLIWNGGSSRLEIWEKWRDCLGFHATKRRQVISLSFWKSLPPSAPFLLRPSICG